MLLRRWIVPAVLFAALFPAAASAQSPHAAVELLCDHSTLAPGEPVTLGLHFKLEKGWHVYWRNPGDSGLAPSINWTLPEGFQAGDLVWPAPQKISMPGLADYGYEKSVLFLVPLTVPPDLKPGRPVNLLARVRWLVCKDICIPGEARLKLRLAVKRRGAPAKPKVEVLFDRARASLPQDWPKEWKLSGAQSKQEFKVFFSADTAFTKAAFYPLHGNQVENAAPQAFHKGEGSAQLTLRRSDQMLKDVPTLEGLLILQDNKSEKAYTVSVPLGGS